jgi:hypothetical protein
MRTGLSFGAEGTLRTESVSDLSFTTIYYQHDKWDANWGGETLFFVLRSGQDRHHRGDLPAP